ncbi:MAG: T9SS type A sorting domain-containing protein [Cytophagaceae bacterium]|nr:T9SS type A sorting domain-containing protein [Cytophagaceae bacterium]
MKKIIKLHNLYIGLKFVVIAVLFSSYSNGFSQSINCGIDDSIISDDIKQLMIISSKGTTESKGKLKADDLLLCNLGIEIDSHTYKEFGNDTLAITLAVLKMVNNANEITEKELNIKLHAASINIWKDESLDPFHGVSNIFISLSKLNSIYPNRDYNIRGFDILVYLPTKTLEGAGGLASGIGSKECVSPLGDIGTLVHELGHNFGSVHTQNCNWPGGPLDYCYQMEGNCYENALEVKQGTVMSYCPKGNIFTFHPLCKSVINNYTLKVLKKITSIPEKIFLPNEVTNNKNKFLFSSSTLAQNYIYEISSDKNFQNILDKDTTLINYINLNATQRNQEYYIRVKSINYLGESSWSNILLLKNSNTYLQVPKVFKPLDGAKGIDISKSIRFELGYIEGVSSYEIQITSYQESEFLNALTFSYNNDKPIEINSQSLNRFNDEVLIWRARSIGDKSISDWSEIKKIIPKFRNSPIKVSFFDTNNAPTNFLLFTSKYSKEEIRLTISENIDFSAPIVLVSKRNLDITINGATSFLIDSLKSNTSYFLKVDFINSLLFPNKNLPNGIIASYSFSFKTTSSEDKTFNTLIHQDNFKELGVNIKELVLSKGLLYFISENSLINLNTQNLSLKKINRQNSNGDFGSTQFFNFLRVDDYGNICKIVELAKIYQYSGIFPKPVYTLRKYEPGSLSLISSEEFFPDFPAYTIKDIEPNNNLLNDGNKIYKITNGNLLPVTNIPIKSNILYSKGKIVWFSFPIPESSITGLIEYDFNSNSFKTIISPSTSPGISISNFKIDSKGNYWAVVSGKGLGKFDGISWSFFNNLNSPLSQTIKGFEINKNDDIFVLDLSSNNFERVHKFSKNSWSLLLNNLPFYSFLKIDEQDNLWFNINLSTLLKIDKCFLITQPNISTKSNLVEIGQNILLKAEGCENVSWKWKSELESGQKNIFGSNLFDFTINSSTSFSASCISNGCFGPESLIQIGILPSIKLGNALPNSVCLKDELVLSPKIEGNFNMENRFYVKLKLDDKTLLFPIEKKPNGSWVMKIGAAILNGKYSLSIFSSSPTINSEDSISVYLSNAPISKIIGNNTICGNNFNNLSAVVEKGTKPFKFLWYKDSIIFENSNNSTLTVNSAGTYKLNVIDALNCSSISNEFNITHFDYPPLPFIKKSIGFILLNTPDTLQISTNPQYQIEWEKDGDVILGENSNKIIVDKPGFYQAVINNNGCKTYSSNIYIDVVLGAELDNFNIEFFVFPNPSNDFIFVELTSKDNINGNLFLVSSNGNILKHFIIKDESSFSKNVIIENLSPGVYYLNFSNDKFSKSFRIVKK